jgi:hypothetical protein
MFLAEVTLPWARKFPHINKVVTLLAVAQSCVWVLMSVTDAIKSRYEMGWWYIYTTLHTQTGLWEGFAHGLNDYTHVTFLCANNDLVYTWSLGTCGHFQVRGRDSVLASVLLRFIFFRPTFIYRYRVWGECYVC